MADSNPGRYLAHGREDANFAVTAAHRAASILIWKMRLLFIAMYGGGFGENVYYCGVMGTAAPPPGTSHATHKFNGVKKHISKRVRARLAAGHSDALNKQQQGCVGRGCADSAVREFVARSHLVPGHARALDHTHIHAVYLTDVCTGLPAHLRPPSAGVPGHRSRCIIDAMQDIECSAHGPFAGIANYMLNVHVAGSVSGLPALQTIFYIIRVPAHQHVIPRAPHLCCVGGMLGCAGRTHGFQGCQDRLNLWCATHGANHERPCQCGNIVDGVRACACFGPFLPAAGGGSEDDDDDEDALFE